MEINQQEKYSIESFQKIMEITICPHSEEINQEFGSQVIRCHEYIDVYVTELDKRLYHYFCNPTTQWRYQKEEIANNIVSRPAVIRQGQSIDVYYVNDKHELIHHCVGEWSKWKNHFELLDTNVAQKKPACTRFGDYIDVYYWKQSGELIHRHVSIKTNWKYTKPNVIAREGGNSLCALKTSPLVLDVYFEKKGQLYHIKNGDHLGWKHTKPIIYPKFPPIKSGSPIRAIRNGNDIDIFYLSQNNRICQILCNPRNNMQHTFERYVNGPGPDNNQFSVTRVGSHIDLYYIKSSQVFHTYSGSNNNWAQDQPQPISDADADYGLCSVRTNHFGIDVCYMSKNGTIRNLSIGQVTYSDNTHYQYVSSETYKKPKYTSHRRIIDWNHLTQNGQCSFLAEGWNAVAHYALIDGVEYIVKKFKRPKLELVLKEIKVLERLNSIHSGILFSELTQNDNLVGLIMKKLKGITVDSFIKTKQLSLTDKMELIISFAKAVRDIQQLGICHSDLHIQNLLVSGQNHIEIIDYGNAILFDSNTLTTSDLTGTDFLRPPEYFKGPYCPVGVNAFQFARIAINIWSGVTFKKFWTLKDSSEEIKDIEKDNHAAEFFRPIIELLNIKNPFERIISQELINELKKSLMETCKLQKFPKVVRPIEVMPMKEENNSKELGQTKIQATI